MQAPDPEIYGTGAMGLQYFVMSVVLAGLTQQAVNSKSETNSGVYTCAFLQFPRKQAISFICQVVYCYDFLFSCTWCCCILLLQTAKTMKVSAIVFVTKYFAPLQTPPLLALNIVSPLFIIGQTLYSLHTTAGAKERRPSECFVIDNKVGYRNDTVPKLQVGMQQSQSLHLGLWGCGSMISTPPLVPSCILITVNTFCTGKSPPPGQCKTLFFYCTQ